MKERPIPFNAEMIRAILAGRKTQTRRLMRPQPEAGTDCPYHMGEGASLKARRCPYGVPGDRLWVRETWRTQHLFANVKPSRMKCGDYGICVNPRIWYEEETAGINAMCRWYNEGTQPARARHRDNGKDRGTYAHHSGYGRLRPSIHMPRWASRITLEVTGVRVERLQDITEADALAEGIAERTCGLNQVCYEISPRQDAFDTARDAFAALWDSINAKRGCSWASNPWVWCVSFPAWEGGTP